MIAPKDQLAMVKEEQKHTVCWSALGVAVQTRRGIEKYYKKLHPEWVTQRQADWRSGVEDLWMSLAPDEREALAQAMN